MFNLHEFLLEFKKKNNKIAVVHAISVYILQSVLGLQKMFV